MLSPIPSGGQEVNIGMEFTAEAALADSMKQLVRPAYYWGFNGTAQLVSHDESESDDEEKRRLIST